MDRDVFFRRFTPTGAAGASSRQVPSAKEVSSLRSPRPTPWVPKLLPLPPAIRVVRDWRNQTP
jgi:hypothetical protein